ncbi:MAG: hypothetical protein QOI76_857 [Frankiales bacterium]|nr:hypothetical protein [Frankiales bacterium]
MSANPLAVLPGLTHYDIFTSPTMASATDVFFANP